MRITTPVKFFFGLFLVTASLGANANLITNGTFDTDLNGWTEEVTGTAFWDSGAAQLGRPGQEMFSEFMQLFTLSPATGSVDVQFDYQWQITAPSIPDTFEAILYFFDATLNDFVAVNLVSESTSTAVFGQTVQFSSSVSLAGIDLAGITNNAKLYFSLFETANTPSSAGTRVQLDNVSATASATDTSVAVPAPATLLLLSLSLIGLGWSKRQKRSN